MELIATPENELGIAILNTQATSNNNYQGYGQTQDTGSHGTLAYNDIVSAIGVLRGQNAFPDTLVLNPSEEASVLKDSNFINAFYFGGLMKKALGPQEFFGQMLGSRTLTSTIQTSGQSLLLDTARACGFVIRRDVTVEHLIDPIKDLSGAAFTSRINLGVMRQNAICLITNA